MKNVTDYLISLASQSPAGSFGLNINNLATSLINLNVVLGVLIIFGRGVLRDFLYNRKSKIVNTIQISKDLYSNAVEKLEKARARLCKVKIETKQLQATGYSEIKREKLNLIHSTYKTLEHWEKKKKETCRFEQHRAINDVQQWVLQQTLQKVLKTLNSILNAELHLRTIRVNIDILGTLE
uniref:ATP synthase CF0 subunit I n=1 Tax=Cuscuta volcanica TaxID=1423681 RepID=UPI002435DEFA|nr:ATP synthase CF0 subunit I [Cuscuta volcanica]WEY30244.1 ATP synthase CF0 subunit I [Cuscuta volcanica]